MMNREEYVEKLKTQIDRWNAEAARWEAQMKQAQGKMREEYARELNAVQSRRDEVLYQMKLLQNASAEAWSDMMSGAEQAWKSMQQAFEQARTHFEKK
jgi:lipid II:glycine glycyltransferase (peptidoglycan interpeptide bridge formation enzyme)